MPELVAVHGAPGPEWATELDRRWSAGDAVVPIDHPLPDPAVAALYRALRPSVRTVAGSGRDERLEGRPILAGDALVLATSGTTGDPKGVILTHDAVRAAATATSERLGVDPDRDAWLCCLPLAHAGGMGVLTRALLTRTPLRVLPSFDAGVVAAQSADLGGAGRAVLTSLVAAALQRIDPAAFRTILLGGDAPPHWPTGRPDAVVVTYGMTETGGGCVYDGVALAGVEVRVTGGEVQLRGPMLGRAYRGPDGDAPLPGSDGWLSTGDGGHVGADGRLVVVGRLADVIVTGGEKVWPGPVEDAIATLPGVGQVAVIGRLDPAWGHRVVALVVPAAGDPPTLAAVRAAVRAALPAWAAPKELELVTSLPTTALGKIQRSSLA